MLSRITSVRKRFSRETQAWIATAGTLALVFLLAMSYDAAMRSASPDRGGGQGRPAWMGKMPERRILADAGAVVGGAQEGERADSYALVIDAGSSGSRVHVYKLKWEAGNPIPKVDLPDQ